jgi:hypothetical protein
MRGRLAKRGHSRLRPTGRANAEKFSTFISLRLSVIAVRHFYKIDGKFSATLWLDSAPFQQPIREFG